VLVPFAVVVSLATAMQPESSEWPSSMVVSTEWLAEHRDDRNLVILHVGQEDTYRKEHIPGARYIHFRDIARRDTGENALPLEMLAPAQLRANLESFGISDDSRIVVYYADEWVSPATRVIFTLDWIGLGDRTVLLDGGFDAWKKSGQPVTNEVPAKGTGKLSAKPVRDIIVDAEWIRAKAPGKGVALIDARAPVYYDGPPHGRHRAGHIPGAINIAFNQVADDRMYLTSLSALRTLFRDAGVKEGDLVAVYCHIGQQATAIIFAARALGHEVRLYDGSFDDWSRRKDLPVETARKGGF
jgi:thiosulfate/3-mercaptopyruvate sulfurtransferase